MYESMLNKILFSLPGILGITLLIKYIVNTIKEDKAKNSKD
ncbi:hypothetical protein [Bacillus pseudomycoides]|nr:hypothetical protein [Bacillus pseudomycoides]